MVFLPRMYQELEKQLPILGRISFSGWIGISLLIALFLLALFKEKIKRIVLKDKDSFYSRAFLSYMDRKKIGVVLGFIILMRTGESMLASMASPFMVDLGIKVHYGDFRRNWPSILNYRGNVRWLDDF